MTEVYINDPTPLEEDLAVEKSLRPSKLDEFIGQKELEASNTLDGQRISIASP